MADPIDREAAYEVLSDYYHHRTEFQHMALRDALSRVPSAQPEAKTPTWKEEDRFVKGYFTWYPYCPKCDHEVVTGQCYCEICGQHIDWSEDDE